MADITKIVLPDNTEYDVKDAKALHMDADNNLVFQNEGSDVGYIHPSSSGLSINAKDSQGNIAGGLYANKSNGSVYVYGNGTDVVFRPYGWSDNTNQVFIDNTGQIHGGTTLYTGTGTIPHSYSGSEVNVSTPILTISNLPSGAYIISGYLTLAFSSSVSGQAYINIKHNNDAYIYDLRQFTSRTSYYLTIASIFNGSGKLTLELDSNQASTVRGGFFALRVG